MSSFKISFIARCPRCQHIEPIHWRGMGQSHADRYGGYAKEGVVPSCQCPGCRKVVDMEMLNAKIEQEGVKR